VKNSLINVGFSNLTAIKVGCVESCGKSKESYRWKNYSLNIPKKEETNLIINHENVKYVIDALNSVEN
jgi:nitrogen regulatory protein PII